MKFYYLFLFVGLFAQTPEAEFLMTSAQAAMAQLGHGSVEVTQGRSSVDVHVKCEGRFRLQLIRLSDGVVMDARSGAEYGEFLYERTSFLVGSYEVRVVFIDEAFRTEAVRIEVDA